MITLAVFYDKDFTIIDDILKNEFTAEDQSKIELIQIDKNEPAIYKEVTHLITGSFKANDLSLLPNLVHIYVPYTGLNGLDLDALSDKGIQVHNTSAHSKFIAERALAFILAIQGKLLPSHQALSMNKWNRQKGDYTDFWQSIFNKKVAIYGYGNIGQHLHTMLAPFHCQIGTLRYKNRSYEQVYNFNELSELAKWCDIFVITVPLNEMTKGTIDHYVLSNLKNKTLINIARGPIINEDDLYKAVSTMGLYGFASDVWFQYPTQDNPEIAPSKYDFTQFDNVIITPHNAGAEVTSSHVRYYDTILQVLNSSLSD